MSIEEVSGTPTQITAPRLAVVITCYNYGRYVSFAINSVLNQKRDDIELIVVDDGSTDHSWANIKDTGVYAIRKKNGGALSACLEGLERTSAPFVLFLDADDELKPGALEKILPKLDDKVAKLQFALTRIDETGKVVGGAWPAIETFRTRDSLIEEITKTGLYRSPPTSGNVFRRDVASLIKEVDYDVHVDRVTLFAAPFFGDIVSLSEELGNYRIHGKNAMGLGASKLKLHAITEQRTEFPQRLAHLERIIKRLGYETTLPDPKHTFYYTQACFSEAIATGGSGKFRALFNLQNALMRETMPADRKLALSLIFNFVCLLPNKAAEAVLAHRYGGEDRSIAGFLKVLQSSFKN
ncbi:MAG: glycosyltransferase family 2 protein [Pseudomonadota bacterium]